jgi:hypothetical protein
MPELLQSLQGRDIGYYQIVAHLWGVELDAPDARGAAAMLAARLLAGDLVHNIVRMLPERAQNALADLLRNDGRLPWAGFTRRYGALREMGPARRDRERPWESADASPVEALFYRALIGRAFFQTKNGSEEFAFIPDDLVELLPDVAWVDEPPLGRPASLMEQAQVFRASDVILDDAATLLAALRIGMPEEEVASFLLTGRETAYPLTPKILRQLLFYAGLLDMQGHPQPEPARAFLEASRAQALASLTKAWLHSRELNELRLLPGLAPEGNWSNDPLLARQAILNFLLTVPGAQALDDQSSERMFWSLASFVSAIHQDTPDFQRQAGEYDTWHLRQVETGEFLRGFENWERVEGALIRFMIGGPLHWLGVLDLAATTLVQPSDPAALTAFRFTIWSMDLLDGIPPAGILEKDELMKVNSQGKLFAPRRLPRAVRYQAARFCTWEDIKDDGYVYRLTPASLSRSRQQGLKLEHLLTLLHRHAQATPPILVRALQRWEAHGAEARLEQVSVLRLRTPELLKEVRASKAGRYLGELLGPTAVIVKPGAADKVLAILAEMGYLGEMIDS